jgi:hypothetical protein
MELILTKEQKQYLDKKGLLSASELQETYKKSVQDQQDMIKKAEEIRKKQD